MEWKLEDVELDFTPPDKFKVGDMRARTALSLTQERQKGEDATNQASSSSFSIVAADRARDIELMPPPLPRYRSERRTNRKKIVLEEDEYTNALEQIIERDFFPDTASLRHNDEDNTNTLAVMIRKNKMSLDKFSRRYTSEDNQSFEEIHEKDLREKREKLHWMHEPQEKGEKAGMLMLYYMDGRKLSVEEREKFDKNLALQYGDINTGESNDDRQNGPTTWKFRVRNQLMFPPELEVSEKISRVTEEEDEVRAKPAIKGWTGNPLIGYDIFNNLTAKNPAILDKEAREVRGNNSYVGKTVIPEKAIVYSNTRIFKNVNEEIQSMRRLSSPLEKPHTPSIHSEESSISSQGNYRTVQMTPLIQPGSEIGSEPVFTWGDISGTPMILDPSPTSTVLSYSIHGGSGSNLSSLTLPIGNSDADSPEFVMQPISRRESLGRDMSSSASGKLENGVIRGRSSRDKLKHKKSSRHSDSKKEISNLTPAALKLAQRLNAGSSTPLRSSVTSSTPAQRSHNSMPLLDGNHLGNHPNESPFGGSLSASYSRPRLTKR